MRVSSLISILFVSAFFTACTEEKISGVYVYELEETKNGNYVALDHKLDFRGDGTVYREFSMLLRIQGIDKEQEDSSSGTYSIKGKSVTVIWDGGDEIYLTLEPNGDLITISDDGKGLRFKKQ